MELAQERELELHAERIREIMSRNTPQHIVGEGSHNFDQAHRVEKEAAERAARQGGVVERSEYWEASASPEQRNARRLESLRREQKTDSTLESKLGGEIRAKYKIEVTFTEGRTLFGSNLLGITLWESGKRFHGGGDELVYWCKDNRQGHDDGCWAPIPGDLIRGEVAVCPNCNRMVNSDLLTNMRIGKVTNRALAAELVTIFHSLGSNADIYIKYHKTDVHYIAMEREKGSDVANRLKGMHIYTLKNILRDTASGADLAKRFYAFVSS